MITILFLRFLRLLVDGATEADILRPIYLPGPKKTLQNKTFESEIFSRLEKPYLSPFSSKLKFLQNFIVPWLTARARLLKL